MKVHAALAATLADHDVTTMFGLVGDGNLFFAESYRADEGGRYIAAAHEAGAILMAAGYAFACRESAWQRCNRDRGWRTRWAPCIRQSGNERRS